MIITADALDGLRQLESCTADTCVTSPPYLGLRDYGVNGQIGLEANPDEYINRLVEVFREVRRVLRDDGTLWVNIGDSYAGSRKGGATHPENAGHYKQGTNRGMIGAAAVTRVSWGGCKPKDLIGIPWMLAFALRADGWYLRQSIIWHKPNCMPESVKDRCTSAHEYILLLAKSQRYYFDYEAIREPAVGFNNQAPAGSQGGLGQPQSRRRKQMQTALDRLASLGIVTTSAVISCGYKPVQSRLSDILEDLDEIRLMIYLLSVKACLGIIRRAEVRGKQLPQLLLTALKAQIKWWRGAA